MTKETSTGERLAASGHRQGKRPQELVLIQISAHWYGTPCIDRQLLYSIRGVAQAIIHNRLGGLQVMPPNTEKWLYIKVRFLFIVSSRRHTDPPLINSLCQVTQYAISAMLWRYSVAACFAPTCTE